MMRFWMILGLVCLLVSAVCAADQPAPVPAAAKVSLQFEDIDAGQALVTLSQKAQVTVLGDTTVKGKVSCSLNNVTAEQALDTICRTNGLEWYKAYVGAVANEKPSAQKILALMDALKALGSTTLICQNVSKQQDTIFVPGSEAGIVSLSPVAEALKLKPVYVVRAVPKPVDPNAAKPAGALGQPPAEVTAAANQVWSYFSQMPQDTQFQVMRELGRMMWQNMSPEQLERMRGMMRDRQGGDGGDRGSWRGGDGRSRDGQGGPPQPPR